MSLLILKGDIYSYIFRLSYIQFYIIYTLLSFTITFYTTKFTCIYIKKNYQPLVHFTYNQKIIGIGRYFLFCFTTNILYII